MFPTSLFNLVLMSKNGQIVQYDDFLVKAASNPHVDPTPEPPVDPYNPLGLPPFTIRCKFDSRYTPTMGDSQTLVDASENIWDITKNSDDWSGLFSADDNPSVLLGVIGANTTNVTDMARMFLNCESLSTVPLFDTSSVIEMFSMFNGCKSLSTVPLFDTSSVTGMSSMFYECTSLTIVPLFDTSSMNDMEEMFMNCTNVQSGALALYQQASTQVTLMTMYRNAFSNCGSSTETGAIELAQIPTSWGGTKAE